jgi:membrane associated rhomboid family serine protease
MFPVGDENRGQQGVPYVTLALIGLNLLVFFYQMTLSLDGLRDFIFTFGTIPDEITQGDDLFTLLTSMFVHGGLGHIAGNLLFLWVFGDNIEGRFGPLLFIAFYLGTGLAASGAHILSNPASEVPSVGASGAISGVMGAYIVLYPRNQVQLLVWFWGILTVPAVFFIGIWFLTQFVNGVAALSVETAQSGGVAFWAHIGGFIAGAAVAVVLGQLRPERAPRRRPNDFSPWG